MRKKTAFATILSFLTPLFVFAQAPTFQSDFPVEQRGEFKSIMHIAGNDFAVPAMIDVPISFDEDVEKEAVVIDAANKPISSTIVSKTDLDELKLDVKDSFNTFNSRSMADDDRETYAEFPFVEESADGTDWVLTSIGSGDDEVRIGEKISEMSEKNVVTIDINASRKFTTDSFTIYLDEHITYPTHVRVVSVNNVGDEHLLLPEKFYTSNKIIFPEETSDHFRITLRYIKPLRIEEIVFHEKNVPEITRNFVRFIAEPGAEYDIYYNTDNHVDIDSGERPRFNVKEEDVLITSPVTNEKNPLYKKADSDEDGIVDSADNCINTENPDQIDLDGNGIGDACEDFDRDGVINATDNCPNVTNRLQTDEDADGIGDVCDNEESRFMEKYPWIPYVVLIVVFMVVVGLIVKTMKQ